MVRKKIWLINQQRRTRKDKKMVYEIIVPYKTSTTTQMYKYYRWD